MFVDRPHLAGVAALFSSITIFRYISGTEAGTSAWLPYYWQGSGMVAPGFKYAFAWSYDDPQHPITETSTNRHVLKCGDVLILPNNHFPWKRIAVHAEDEQPAHIISGSDKQTTPSSSSTVEQSKLANRRVRRKAELHTNFTRQNGFVDLMAGEQSARSSTDGGTFHPAVTLPVDAIYLLLIKISPQDEKTDVNVSFEIRWKAQHGYLSAVDYPLLPFYGVMCALYALFAIYWLVSSALQWKDLLRIQFWIGGVIFLGMLEKAVFCAEYETMNRTGESVTYAIQLAEIVSCLKKTLARMLVIIVSVGFGVVKPRLGSTLHKVVGVGFLYFILCSIESISRVAKVQHDGPKQKQLVALPLVLLDVGICWWIFTALLGTMRTLRLRRNETKLWLYRHFTNTLIVAVLTSLVFMIWSLVQHTFTRCLKDWKELWVDTAFWHLLFCVILMVILVLFRPTQNNQRYAFSPLLDAVDDEEDEDEEDIVFNEAFTDTDTMKIRNLKPGDSGNKDKKEASSLEDELKWVDENIPSSLTDKALPVLADSDDEREKTRYEISKMQ
jgi:hypothetical protein